MKIKRITKDNIMFIHDITEIYEYMKNKFEKYYPNFNEWYFNTVVPEVKENIRDIFIIINEMNDICGIAIIKKPIKKYKNKSSKICSFYIDEKFRHKNIGKLLFKKCLDELKQYNKDIIITVPEERLTKSFLKFLNEYGFEIINKEKNKYRIDKIEYILKKE